LTKALVIERVFEYNRGMELGDSTNEQRDSAYPGAALDALHTALNDVISTVESGGLEQLKAAGRWRCGNASKDPQSTSAG
jgi:hypothetical protein